MGGLINLLGGVAPRRALGISQALYDAALADIADLEGQVTDLEAEVALGGWAPLADINFAAAANLNVKALGNGDQTVAGLPVTLATVANATSMDIVNGTGLVLVYGAARTDLRVRTGAIAGAPAAPAGRAHVYRARLWSSFTGQDGGDYAAFYWTNVATSLRAGFTRTPTNFYTWVGSNFGAVGDTSFMQIVGMQGATSLWAGATPEVAVPRGYSVPGFEDTTSWGGEIPTLGLDGVVGPFTWTISRLVIDYRDALV